MGVIDFCNTSSLCMIKSSYSEPSCKFEVNQRKVVAMASTLPVKQVTEDGQQKVTGDSFIRPHLRKLSPYQPILPFEVFEALGNMKFPYVYPDPESRRLRAALAEDSGLDSDNILVGCGADELIDLIMRCVLEPGDKIVDCPPTFTMYEFDANVNAAVVLKAPRHADFSLNVEEISRVVELEKPKCVFLTSPNNPDGSDEVLLKILNLPVLVILDEAYIEFSGLESRMKWVTQHENLIVLRTFSKRAGLAGLRVGYGAFPSSIIEYLWRAKQPYNVSVAAELAACAALQNPAYLENVKEALVKEREKLYKLLQEVPFLKPFPSYSNFILCEVTTGLDAKKLKEDLSKMGVMIRHYNKKELCGYVRVSVGKPEHTDALMKCAEVLSSLLIDLQWLQKSLEENPLSFRWCSDAMSIIKKTHSQFLADFERLEVPASWDVVHMLDEYLNATLDMLDLCNLLKSVISGLDRYRMMIDFMVNKLNDASFSTMASKNEFEIIKRENHNKFFNVKKLREMNLDKDGVSKVKLKNGTNMHALQAFRSTMSIISLFVFCSIRHPIPIKIDKELYTRFYNLDSSSNCIRKLITSLGERFQSAQELRRPVLLEIEMIEDAFANFKEHVMSSKKVTIDDKILAKTLEVLKKRSLALKEGLDLLECEVNELFENLIEGRARVINLITITNH
ncbi:Histidinol-phosphate aminotransferase chloroplastic [Bienertia sinuspersici]